MTRIRNHVAMLSLVLFCSATAAATSLTTIDLRCEFRTEPLGVDVEQPRLFWKLESKERGAKQTAYQIVVASSAANLKAGKADLWDSGKVVSDETIHIRYAGTALKSSQQVFWKVRSWDSDGRVSAWSKPASWTMGVLSEADWQGAQWIGVVNSNIPNVLLRREFTLKPNLERALVHISGLGHYEMFVNGKKSGNDLLAPGWTKYNKTILYETHDITKLLQRSGNAIGITLGNGMYNSIGGGRFTKFKGSFGGQKAIAQIRLEYADGQVETLVTDGSWKRSDGPITFGTIYGGEDFDARLIQRGWSEPKFDDSKWQVAQNLGGPGGALRGISSAAPPLREIEIHRPVATRGVTNNEVVYDLGQNTSHMPRLRVTGPRGSKVRLTPSEIVDDDGSANQRTMGAGRRGNSWWEYTKGTDGVEEWMPQFFYVGCRYMQARLTAATEGGALPKIKSLEGVVVHSSSEPTGEFSCSNELFNRIRTLVRWAQRANMVSVLTDCPHREKLGWLEQYHLNGPAIRYEFDLDALYTKGMNDMADSQLSNGLVPTTAPEYTIFRDAGDTNNLRGKFGDSPEWGSANLLVPWQQYEFSGDLDMLRKNYDTMKRYVAHLASRATNNILSHGLGDWYDIGPKPPGVSQLTPIPLPATAFYFHDNWLLSRIATLLGKEDDAKQFAAKAEEIRLAFNEKFYDPTNHTYATSSQAANSFPLVMGIAEETNRAAVLDAIVADVRSRGNTAGDVGYRYLLRALADGGRSDVIFDINNQSDKPGYGYQLKMGATSLTEAWDARRTSSHNHFMLGQITEWFYHDLAGIASDPSGPGFKKIIINPQPVGDVTWTRASYNSIHGKIVSDWKRTGNKFTLRVTIPANTTARVFVPAKPGTTVTERNIPIAKSPGVKLVETKADRVILDVASGSYEFTSQF